uniref:F-box domain-containing protein n=1 Tax=Graphocephala atropunctata TaxID=36148 RepID=A0A1B6M736_9HEMI
MLSVVVDMSLSELPVEVLEEIFQYLPVEDMFSAWHAVGVEGSDHYWAGVCWRKGLYKLEDDDNWRTVIQRHWNWRIQNFVRREHKVLDTFDKFDICLLDGNLIFERNKDGNLHTLTVVDVSSNPKIIQRFIGVYEFVVFNSKLLVHEGSMYRIFNLQHGQYHEIFQTELQLQCFGLSNKYFTFQHSLSRTIQVVDLESLQEFNYMSHESIETMKLCNDVLNIVYHKQSIYGLRRYDLKKMILLHDFVFCKNSYLIVSWISSHLVVYLNILEAHSNLYVYGFSGELLTTLAVSDFIAVEGEYVVYITYASVLNIWTCRTPNVATITLDLGPDRSIGRNIVSGSLLVLSYFDHLKVIDTTREVFFMMLSLEPGFQHHSLDSYRSPVMFYSYK